MQIMKIHFIGIGGIGVSALAQYYLTEGHQITGSDLADSEIADLLAKKGANLFLGAHKPENLPEKIDLVVHSPAIKQDNPELKKAKDLGVKCQAYPEALGELTKKYFTIAVSGTHGKSTTSAMASMVLIKAGLDPTVIIGTKLKEFNNSNFRAGKSKYLVIEADEYGASFLRYYPQIIVLLNIEREHLDYYKNLSQILKTFKKYLACLNINGFLIANRDDKNINAIIGSRTAKNTIYFSKQQKQDIKSLKAVLQTPGKHNLLNALAVLKLARVLEIPDKTTLKALSEFKGSWRRFEEKEVIIDHLSFISISDYGHHPTEVLATLKAARQKYQDKTIWLVFQPHQYQRTFYFFQDFVKVFQQARAKNLADKIIITDIFDVAGRETKQIKQKTSSEKMVRKIADRNVLYLTKNKIIEYLKTKIKDREIVMIMGAGDIYKIIEEF